MKNYFKKLALLFTVSFILIISCSKNDDSNQNGNIQEDNLFDPVDDELNNMLEAIPSDTSIEASDLKFEDGSSMLDFIQQNDPNFLNEHIVNRTMAAQSLTPENQLKLLIGEMALMAQSLVKRNNWSNYSGSNQPNGLAYNWGSKNHKNSQKPGNYPRGSSTPNLCQDFLYGLDCSGMVYQMGLAAGVNLAAGGCSAEFERNEANWNNKFSQSTNYKDLRAKLFKHTGVSATDSTYIDINGIKEGDLIFKTDNGTAVHVGMVLRANFASNLSIYQSNGKPQLDCDANKSTSCGPRIISLLSSEVFGSGKLFGIDWQILRFETKGNDVTIGTQKWMRKNLNVSKYRNGDDIPQVQDPTAWGNLTTGAWCYYENNTANGTVYGKLYNWYAANDPRGLAPTGYHIPSDAEWTTLTNFLGGESVAGNKMKATTLWTPYSGIINTNSSSFTGLPGGYRANNGPFAGIGYGGRWWSSSEIATSNAWFRAIDYNNSSTFRLNDPKRSGYSLRCLRD